MERIATLFLRFVILVIAAAAIIACIFILPNAMRVLGEIAAEDGIPQFLSLRYPFVIGLYTSVLPLFFALFQSLKLLSYIDNKKAFTKISVKALDYIGYCTVVMSIIYVSCFMPVVYYIAEAEDAPGLILIGFAFSCAPFVVATIAYVFKKLLQQVMDLIPKSN